MTVSVWFRAEGEKPIRLGKATTPIMAERLAERYRAILNARVEAPLRVKDKVWSGRRRDEPFDLEGEL